MFVVLCTDSGLTAVNS